MDFFFLGALREFMLNHRFFQLGLLPSLMHKHLCEIPYVFMKTEIFGRFA